MDINDDEISKHGIQAVNVLQPAISRFGFNDPKKVYFIIYGGSNRDVCASSQLPSYATEGVTANTAALYYPGKRSGSCIENNGGFKPEFNETAKAALHEILHVLGPYHSVQKIISFLKMKVQLMMASEGTYQYLVI